MDFIKNLDERFPWLVGPCESDLAVPGRANSRHSAAGEDANNRAQYIGQVSGRRYIDHEGLHQVGSKCWTFNHLYSILRPQIPEEI